jgi:type IV secretory pathway protease TraF
VKARARCWLLFWIAASTAAIALLWGPRLLGAPMLVIWERGTSMPHGFYLYAHAAPASRGEIVALDDAPNWGRSYLLKRVAGVGGVRYCWDRDNERHELAGRIMPGPSAQAIALGIKVWTGCRRLRDDEIAVYSDHVDSYDSRYFGPVTQDQIMGVYRLILPLPQSDS